MGWSEFDLIDHTLRGPLNTALVNLELLSSSQPEPTREIERVREEIRRLANTLMPAMFDILSLEIAAVTRGNLRSMVTRALEAHGLAGVDVAPAPWPDATVDGRLLGLAVVHLARNALAATPAGTRRPEIAAAAGREGWVDVLVRDWGVGVGQGHASRPYPSRRGHLGGVIAAVRIARLHGGTVSFESMDPGAVVRLSLPPRSE
jgi:signal transduction histidine kinase